MYRNVYILHNMVLCYVVPTTQFPQYLLIDKFSYPNHVLKDDKKYYIQFYRVILCGT